MRFSFSSDHRFSEAKAKKERRKDRIERRRIERPSLYEKKRNIRFSTLMQPIFAYAKRVCTTERKLAFIACDHKGYLCVFLSLSLSLSLPLPRTHRARSALWPFHQSHIVTSSFHDTRYRCFLTKSAHNPISFRSPTLSLLLPEYSVFFSLLLGKRALFAISGNGLRHLRRNVFRRIAKELFSFPFRFRPPFFVCFGPRTDHCFLPIPILGDALSGGPVMSSAVIVPARRREREKID